MTILFLDSSSFVKMFLDEMASVTLRGTLSQVGDDAKAISALAQVEVRSAIQRRFRNREFSSQTLSTAVMDLEVVVTEWVRIPINEKVIGLTSGVITRHALRSLDALQLSSAMALRDEIDEEDNVLFIACDNRLLNAAKSEGFAIWNPEISAAPPAPPVN